METVPPELQAHVAQLDKHLEHTETVKGLKAGQNEIMDEFKRHEEENRDQFKKGAARMDGIDGKMDKFIEMIMQSNADRDRQHGELKNEIRDDKLRELTSKLEKAEGKNEKYDRRTWDVAMKFLTATLGLVTVGLLVALNWK